MTVYQWWLIIPFVVVSAWIMLGHRRRVARWRAKQARRADLSMSQPPVITAAGVDETRERWVKPMASDPSDERSGTTPHGAESGGDAPGVRTLHELLGLIDDEIERLWPALPKPSEAQIETGGAFGLGSMAFAQWLKFVFLPNAHLRLDDDSLPSTSSVATMAAREFGDPAADALVTLLSEFDKAVEEAGRL